MRTIGQQFYDALGVCEPANTWEATAILLAYCSLEAHLIELLENAVLVVLSASKAPTRRGEKVEGWGPQEGRLVVECRDIQLARRVMGLRR